VRLAPDLPGCELHSAFRSQEVPSEAAKPGGERSKTRQRDFLLVIELGLITAFLVLVSAGFRFLQDSNQEVARAFSLPELTPTAAIQAVVIPSGHIPPSGEGRTRPNEAEIPLHLRPLAQVYAQIPTQTLGPEHGIRIRIPALNVDAPIVQGDGWEQLKKGVGQHTGTANPGQKGNMVLSGHNDVFGEVFRYLDQLEPGDEIIIYSPQRAYTYIVTEWFLVDPDQVEVLAPTPTPVVTLISCYPYMVNNKRIIVRAHLQG
jgi:sortase A